jgi:hypothetical protein
MPIASLECSRVIYVFYYHVQHTSIFVLHPTNPHCVLLGPIYIHSAYSPSRLGPFPSFYLSLPHSPSRLHYSPCRLPYPPSRLPDYSLHFQ